MTIWPFLYFIWVDGLSDDVQRTRENNGNSNDISRDGSVCQTNKTRLHPLSELLQHDQYYRAIMRTKEELDWDNTELTT